jgi:putative ABC transport system permease protein
MLAYTLRGLAAHRVRSLGMALAVFLGVALVSGTFILTDTINRSFDDIFDQALKGTDVVVTPKELVRQDMEEPPPFRASVLQRVREVPGVESAAGSVNALVRLVDDDGEQLGNGFAPNFVFSVAPEPFVPVTYSEGRAPRGPTEVALDKGTAERSDLGIGDRVGVAGDTSVTRYRIVGINQLGDASTGGSASATLTLPEAQRVTDRAGKFDQISIAAAPGVNPVVLKRRVQRVLPRTLRAETASENAGREGDEIASDLSFFTIALLVLSGVIVVVAAFLIFNTFSITVAQRIREFGLLRTLGAKRSQVLGAVVGEAALIGGLGTAAGVPGGFGAAQGLRALMKAIGIDLPSTGNVFLTRTLIVAVCVGLGVALVAAITPALRATRVTPMAALLDAALPERKGRGRVIAGVAALMAIGGVALVLVGLFGGIESAGSAAGLTGGGAALVLFAVSLFSPRLVKPLASLAGKPLERLRGITGRLARENAMRKPGRTAVTAAALMIGVAMVVFVTVFAAGITSSVNGAIDRNLQGDVFVQNTDGFSPIPASVATEVRGLPGAGSVSSVRFGTAKVDGVRGRSRVAGVDPAHVTDVLNLEWKEGSEATLRSLDARQTVVDDAWAKSNGVDLGDTVRTLGPSGRRGTYEVVGSVKDNADFLGNMVITQPELRRAFDVKRDTYVLVDAAPGASANALQSRIEKLLKRRYPSAEALNQQQLKDDQEAQLQPLLALVYGLLFLAVLVSIFGIVNTLALSIHERTRELGMLRAIGMTRRQVKRMVRYESVITALIGAILGTGLGVIFAAVVSRPLADEGFSLSYPIGNLVAILVLAALAGVLAAILPARRAAQLEVLDALAYE